MLPHSSLLNWLENSSHFTNSMNVLPYHTRSALRSPAWIAFSWYHLFFAFHTLWAARLLYFCQWWWIWHCSYTEKSFIAFKQTNQASIPCFNTHQQSDILKGQHICVGVVQSCIILQPVKSLLCVHLLAIKQSMGEEACKMKVRELQ